MYDNIKLQMADMEAKGSAKREAFVSCLFSFLFCSVLFYLTVGLVSLFTCKYVNLYVCLYVCMYVCMYD